MRCLFTCLLSLFLSSSVIGQLDTVRTFAKMIKSNHNFGLNNPIFDESSIMTCSNNADTISKYGAAFSLAYKNEAGTTGFDGYPSGTIGGFRVSGTYYPGDPSKCGMPVKIEDLNNEFRIRWKTNQINANDPDDKWWATINVIFDGGEKNAMPTVADRDYDLVIQLEKSEQDDLSDKAKGSGGASYWWFARDADDELIPFTLNIDGNEYQWAVRYKFHEYASTHNQAHKNNKVHIKFIPIDNSNVAPYLDHPLKSFVDSTKTFLRFLDLPDAEETLAQQKVALDSLWVKSLSAGYEVYSGESTLENIHFYSILDNQAPTSLNLKSVVNRNGKNVVRWFQSNEKSLAYYSVYRSINGGTYSKIVAETRDTTFKDYEITNGNTYSYFITASDRSFNESTESNIKSVSISSLDASVTARVINSNMLSNFQIQVYPNPATDQLTIASTDLNNKTINIFNIAGQNMTNQYNFISNGIEKVVLDISTLTQGLYLIKIGNNTQKVFVK